MLVLDLDTSFSLVTWPPGPSVLNTLPTLVVGQYSIGNRVSDRHPFLLLHVVTSLLIISVAGFFLLFFMIRKTPDNFPGLCMMLKYKTFKLNNVSSFSNYPFKICDMTANGLWTTCRIRASERVLRGTS